ncbi:large subunit ribosomal protein L18 [Mycoplasmoides fastidiosum]|uniref:Large ribosomal subunit protein uL18 n=1 Tax=Mycoplasmoides fastidiosum TaxID=92758 RepID=A0ABU0LY54_9BACT|nr:50S ribosomal protein L18 [Mycoplasmoides fastidiosum]MDQ0513618.1 large subunit ribosomal protein L18 [Mycoplasmoides fastidiosum]UUD37959.1 50S ribosomal protein L18 [Mycoplasmoides fastidiosum]
MKNINLNRRQKSLLRHKRILKAVRRSNEHLRARITKTNGHIYVQLIDDQANKVLFAASSLQLKLANGNKTNATKVALDFANKLKAHNISQISFDRGGSKYHGRIAVIAETLRENGIKV